MLELSKIKYITIYVSDFDRALMFYKQGLGLKPTYVEDGFAQFETGECYFSH